MTIHAKKIIYCALLFCGAYVSFCSETKAEPPTVFGAIRDKWIMLGAGNGFLVGQPVTNEQPTFDGAGRWQQFQGGIISWHPDTGAFSVRGLIGELWIRLGREKFGYLIIDELLC
jgi:uncharacterized protein with LGFP repeats